jgi:hypothetical protein
MPRLAVIVSHAIVRGANGYVPDEGGRSRHDGTLDEKEALGASTSSSAIASAASHLLARPSGAGSQPPVARSNLSTSK